MKKERTQMSKFVQVLIVGVFIALANGSGYVWSVYGSYMMSQNGWTATMASLPYTLNVIVSAFSPLIGGMICDRYKPKYSVWLAGLLYFLGWYLCGSVNSPWAIILLYGFLLGAAQGINPNAVTSTTTKWAPENKRGLAAGIGMAANGLSSLYMAPLAVTLLAIGLTKAFHTMAFISGGLCLIGGFFLLTPENRESDLDRAARKEADKAYFKKVVKTDRFWLLWVIYAISLIGGGVVFSQCANIARLQANWAGGYVLVAILAVANGGGRVLFNAISDRLGIYRTFTLMYVLSIAGMAILMFASSIPMLVIGVLLVGSTFGATNSILYPAAAYEFGTANLSRVVAFLVIGFLFNGFLGSTIAGVCLDATGTYTLAYVFGIVMLAVSIVLVQFLRKAHDKAFAGKAAIAE